MATRKVYAEELRERQRMRDAPRKNGDWCVVGFCDEWSPPVGLQGQGYESESEAKEKADELDKLEEFQHVDRHEVMKIDEYESLCQERGIDPYPWDN